MVDKSFKYKAGTIVELCRVFNFLMDVGGSWNLFPHNHDFGLHQVVNYMLF